MRFFTDSGTVIETEGLDMHLYLGADETPRLAFYPMARDKRGLWQTDLTEAITIITPDFEPGTVTDDDDDWFGYSEDTAPGELPWQIGAALQKVLDTRQQV